MAALVTRVGCCEIGGTAVAEAWTTDQDDYSIDTVGSRPAAQLRVPVNSAVTLTGLVSTVTDQYVTITNTGTHTLTITDEDSSSAAANRIRTVTRGNLEVHPGMSVYLRRDSSISRWRVLDGTAVSYDTTPGPIQTVSTNQDDFTFTVPSPVQRLDITTAVTFTGVYLPPGLPAVEIWNVGTGTATFTHQGGGSIATNRITTPTAASFVLPPGGSMVLRRDPAGTGSRVPGGSAVLRPGSIALPAVTAPATPASGSVIYVDTADSILKAKDSAGSVTTLGGGDASEGTLAATGNNQGTAAAIVTDAVEVTGADNVKGVILPVGAAGSQVVVWNNSASSLNLYPPSGAELGLGGGANVPLLMAGNLRLLAVRLDATQWFHVTLS